MPVASAVVCCRRPDGLVRYALLGAVALGAGLVVGCGGSSAAPPAATPVEAVAAARASADRGSASRATPTAAPAAAERTVGDRSAEPEPPAVRDAAAHIAAGLDELEEEAEAERQEEDRQDRERMKSLLGGSSLGGPGSRGGGGLGGIGLGGGGSGYGSGGYGRSGAGLGAFGPGAGVGGRSVPKPPPEPKLLVSEPRVTGPAPGEVVQRRLQARRHRFVNCYERAAKKNAALRGRVALRFRIKADGRVDQVSTTGSSLASPEARSCIAALVGKVRFGAQKTPSQVRCDLDFSPP